MISLRKHPLHGLFTVLIFGSSLLWTAVAQADRLGFFEVYCPGLITAAAEQGMARPDGEPFAVVKCLEQKFCSPSDFQLLCESYDNEGDPCTTRTFTDVNANAIDDDCEGLDSEDVALLGDDPDDDGVLGEEDACPDLYDPTNTCLEAKEPEEGIVGDGPTPTTLAKPIPPVQTAQMGLFGTGIPGSGEGCTLHAPSQRVGASGLLYAVLLFAIGSFLVSHRRRHT
ncbi:MAG: hypothetical protein HYV02_07775 [Deltaproteobacteria bacterium]|nr:hypothetical protein [Deltaproteobacteria bacterium]